MNGKALEQRTALAVSAWPVVTYVTTVMCATWITPIYCYHSAAEGYIQGEDLQIYSRVHLSRLGSAPMASTHVEALYSSGS